MAATRRLLADLRAAVGERHVLTDPDVTAGYLQDWTGHYRGAAAAVVRPESTDQVAAVLRICHAAGVAVVPQGGNTGLVGGAVPSVGQVLLSTRRLTGPIEVDPVARSLGAGAGTTLAAAQAAAAAEGLDLGLDLAARDSATLGGLVATNAGGLRMVRHGDTRSRILGLVAVTADGRVLRRWSPLRKDNVGYHLPGLIAGSEGTLAVVTAVLLRLSAPAGPGATGLIGIDSAAGGLGIVDACQRAGLRVEAAELITAAGAAMVSAHLGVADPLPADAPLRLLLEVTGGGADPAERLAEVLGAAGDRVRAAVVDHGAPERLWRLREAHTETISAVSATPPLKLDVTVPAGALDPFLGAVGPAVAAVAPAGATTVCFGHVADGNIHVNVLDLPAGAAGDPPDAGVRGEVTGAVLGLVVAHDGSISAEHGIGRAKAPWLALGRTPVDRELMAATRRAWDPAGLLNPEVLDFGAGPD